MKRSSSIRCMAIIACVVVLLVVGVVCPQYSMTATAWADCGAD